MEGEGWGGGGGGGGGYDPVLDTKERLSVVYIPFFKRY